MTRTWGTQLDVRGSSLPAGEVLFLAVTDRDGHQYDVASWTGTRERPHHAHGGVLDEARRHRPGPGPHPGGTPVATATA